MITNERQYKITKMQSQKLQEALSNFDPSKENLHFSSEILQIQKDALASQLSDFLAEIEEYEKLKSGLIKISPVTNISDLPNVLIKARIAQGLTQADFAQKLNLKEQQVQRYEAEKYYSASLKKLIEIADVLSIKLEGTADLATIAEGEKDHWKSFPINEMYKRGWFEGFTGSLKEAKDNSEEILRDFFDYAGLNQNSLCFHRKSIRSGSQLDEFSLQAWQARVLIKARKKKSNIEFRKKEISESWIKDLVRLSYNRDAINEVESFLSAKGIIFVIEPHLQGTHLDGAAMLLSRDCPVIAMTLRYDRLDNFWFVLLHELAHVLLHLGKDDLSEIFDDEIETSVGGIEAEADEFALDALIPEKIWKTSVARFALTEKSVIKQAKALGVDASIIAGRLRKETGNYTLFNNLIGHNEVRKYFFDEISI